MGILLALVWPWIERLRRAVPLLELLGVAALVGTVLLFRQMQDFNPTLYRGGDLAAAFCFAVLIAAVAHPRTGIGEALGVAPLRWVGERSYGIYLWHWPIIVLVAGRERADRASASWSREAALVLAVAALSYRYVEQPIRTGRLQRRLAQHPRRTRLEVIGAGAVGLVVAFAILFVVPTLAEPGLGLRQPAEGAGRHDTTSGSTSGRPPWSPTQTHAQAQEEARAAAGPDPRARRLGHARLLVPAEDGAPPPRARRRDGRPADRGHGQRAQTLRATPQAAEDRRAPGREQRPALVPRPRAATSRAARDPGHRRRQRPQRHELAGRVEPRARQLAARLAARRTSPTGTGNSTTKMLQDGTHPWPYGCTDLRARDRRHAAVGLRRVPSGGLLGGALVDGGLRRREHVRAAVEHEHDRQQVELGQQLLSLAEQQRETVGLVADLGREEPQPSSSCDQPGQRGRRLTRKACAASNVGSSKSTTSLS